MVRLSLPDPARVSIFALRLILAAAAIGVTSWAAPLKAEPAVDVELRYTASAACPEQGRFVEAVNARVRRPVEWGAAAGAIEMMVSVELGTDHASGKLEVIQSSAEPTRREFTALTCDEVVSALALVASLALDPNARTEPLPPSPSPSQGDFPAELPTPTPVEEPALPSPAPTPPRPTRVNSTGTEAKRSQYSAWVGPSAGVAAGYAPTALVSLGLSAGLRRVRAGISPALQLSALWGETGVTGPSADAGSFAWAMGRLEACPLQLALGSGFMLEPCAAVEAGRLKARGANAEIAEPVVARRAWLAAGATLGLHAQLEHFYIRIAGLALIPATRDEFVFRSPDRSVHQAGLLVGGASLGIGFQWEP